MRDVGLRLAIYFFKRKILFFHFFIVSLAFGNEEAKTLFVSLGSHCEVAGRLKGNQLRTASFPFDWLMTLNHELFVRLLDDKFRYFLEERYFFQHPTHRHVVENSYYEIEFRHDWPFPTQWSDSERYLFQLQEMRSKYERRIERFLKLDQYPGRVYFIRAAYDFSLGALLCWEREGIEQIDRKQAEELKAALDRLFPSLDFRLVIINYREEEVDPIEGIDRVIEFKITKPRRESDYRKLLFTLQCDYLLSSQ